MVRSKREAELMQNQTEHKGNGILMSWDGKENRRMSKHDVEIGEKLARLEEKVIASEKAMQLAKENVKLTTDAMDKRLEGMNEFRAALKDQNSTFVTKAEFELLKESRGRELRELQEARLISDSKASQKSVTMSFFVAYAAVLISLVGMLINLVRLWGSMP
jgi:hypothetical protein